MKAALIVFSVLGAFALFSTWQIDGWRGLFVASVVAVVVWRLLLWARTRPSWDASARRGTPAWAVVAAAVIVVLVPSRFLFNTYGTPVLGAFVGCCLALPQLVRPSSG